MDKIVESIVSAEKMDESKAAGRKRPPPEPLPSRTRSTRAVKAAKRAYSPPLPSSSSSSKRATRPSNKVKFVQPPLPPTPSPQPVTVKVVKEKETKTKANNNEAAISKQNKPTTFDGQLELIHRASDDNTFARTLVTALNHHADKVVDNVRAKRNKSKNKLSRTMMLQEMKNSKRIDINTPESILTTVNLSSIINRKNFEKLPSYYQYHLTKLLPKCDQNVMPNLVITPSESALNNEFFSRALMSFSHRLTEGRLTYETLAKLKREMEREKKNLDHLKVKYFEPYFKDPEEQSSKETQFEQDLSFLQTMSNCFEVVKCFCKNETFAKPVNIIRKGTTNTPSVHFCETVSSDDGKTMPIKESELVKDGKLCKQPNDTSAKESTKSESLIPMLSKEKKNNNNIIEEVLNFVDQAEFERKVLNPKKVILAPRQEPLIQCNYIQSMYYINSLVIKLIDQIQIHKKNFRKLHLACKVIFLSLDYLYDKCSNFLKSFQRLPNFPNVSLAITSVALDGFLVGLPEEVNKVLTGIENFSNSSLISMMNLNHHDYNTYNDEYLSNTNDIMIKHMIERGLNITSSLFEHIKKQLNTTTIFSYIDHLEYLRAVHSYRSLCKSAMEVINSGIENAGGGAAGEVNYQAQGPSQLMMPIVTNAPVGMTFV